MEGRLQDRAGELPMPVACQDTSARPLLNLRRSFFVIQPRPEKKMLRINFAAI